MLEAESSISVTVFDRVFNVLSEDVLSFQSWLFRGDITGVLGAVWKPGNIVKKSSLFV